jgi:DNA-binding MarR family transcriptional regulator
MANEEPIGLLIASARRRLKQAVGSHAHSFGLTTQQFWVLVAISEHPGCSLGELAAHLRMDNPTASRVLFTLLSRKFVEVRGDASDRRRTRVYLRAPGEALKDRLHQLAAAVRAAIVQGLSTEEQATLRASLRKVITNMDRFQHGDPTVGSTRTTARRRSSEATVPRARTPRRRTP